MSQTCSLSGYNKEMCLNSDEPKCPNCGALHSASSKVCPKFVVEKNTLLIKAENQCSLAKASKQAEQAPTDSDTRRDSYASAASINTNTTNQLTQLRNHNQAHQHENESQSHIILVLQAQNQLLQDRITKMSASITELHHLIN